MSLLSIESRSIEAFGLDAYEITLEFQELVSLLLGEVPDREVAEERSKDADVHQAFELRYLRRILTRAGSRLPRCTSDLSEIVYFANSIHNWQYCQIYILYFWHPCHRWDKMVQIGRNVKYDDYGRVTIPAQLAELMNLIKGHDEVCWIVGDGEVVLKKVTKSYHGMDFEGEEIRDKLLEYESKYYGDHNPDEDYSPEELEKMAREEYLRDKAEREAFIKTKKN